MVIFLLLLQHNHTVIQLKNEFISTKPGLDPKIKRVCLRISKIRETMFTRLLAVRLLAVCLRIFAELVDGNNGVADVRYL